MVFIGGIRSVATWNLIAGPFYSRNGAKTSVVPRCGSGWRSSIRRGRPRPTSELHVGPAVVPATALITAAPTTGGPEVVTDALHTAGKAVVGGARRVT